MKRDKLIWLICILVFLAGVIWGMGWPKINFFKVDSIHDLAEIASSLATVAAVFIALTAWKRQIRAQGDHDLARRILVKSEQFQSATFQLVIDAQFCIANENIDEADHNVIDRLQASMQSRLDGQEVARTEFQAVLLEARALWSEDLDENYKELLTVAANAYICVDGFVKYLYESANPNRLEPASISLKAFREYFSANGLGTSVNEINPILSGMKKGANEILKRKLQLY